MLTKDAIKNTVGIAVKCLLFTGCALPPEDLPTTQAILDSTTYDVSADLVADVTGAPSMLECTFHPVNAAHLEKSAENGTITQQTPVNRNSTDSQETQCIKNAGATKVEPETDPGDQSQINDVSFLMMLANCTSIELSG